MLKIQCLEHFEEVKKFAERRNLSEDLQKSLDYLNMYACHEEDLERTECDLYSDFSPFSFTFQMKIKNKNGQYERWFNGGLIYFGEGDSGVNFPQFSVRVGSTNEGWSVHT